MIRAWVDEQSGSVESPRGSAPEPKLEPQRGLSSVDVRASLDAAVGRSWLEMAWRFARTAGLLLSDVASSIAALSVAMAVESWTGGFALSRTVPFLSTIPLLHAVGIALMGAYGLGARRKDLDRIASGTMFGTLLALANGMLLGHNVLSLETAWLIGLYMLLAVVFSFVGRRFLDAVAHRAYRYGIGQRRVLVVGSADETKSLAALLEGRNEQHLRIVGRLSPTDRPDEGAIGSIADLGRVLETTRAHGVLVDAGLTFEALETLVHRCFGYGLTVALVPRLLHQLSPRLDLRETRAGSVVQLRPQGPRLPQLAMKRVVDVIISSVLLVLLAPVLGLIALAIRVDSRGPILFKQVRAGIGGQPFEMFKFRTMVRDADAQKKDLHHLNESGDPRLFKIRNDPRVTSIGAILRKLSLDELPQLLNVLRGEMSVVGPRPFFPDDLHGYAEHHFARLAVLPGITGLWQVKGRSSMVDFEEVVRFDTEYIRKWSVWLDMKILLQTIPAVCRRTGAY